MTAWAFIVAIETYPGIAGGLARELPGTSAAAAAFREWVMTEKNVPEANVITCAESALTWRATGTTCPEIKTALVGLVQRARENAAELYVFFSGHGIGFAGDPYLPAIDVLLGSEFSDPSTSGTACIIVAELKEKLRVALGPGKHFYFIDACRNPMGRGDIEPAALGLVLGRSARGNATTFLLFSTGTGDIAKINSGFCTALLRGLRGAGRAKEWLGGRLHVTFDRLCTYVQQALQKDNIEPEAKGPLASSDDSIVQLEPTPMSICTVEVMGADATHQFTLTAIDLRRVARAPVTFLGPRSTVSFVPEDYLLELANSSGQPVQQVDPPPDLQQGVDLYDDRTVQFALGPPAVSPQTPLVPAISMLRIAGVPGAEISLQEIATGEMQTIRMPGEGYVVSLVPGEYRAQLQDGNFRLGSARVLVGSSASVDLDFAPKVLPGAQTSLVGAIPNQQSLISFSETLSDVRDWNLSLWLAVLGASRILAAPDTFSKLRDLQLEQFDHAVPEASVLYVLAGEVDPDCKPTWGTGRAPVQRLMQTVPDLPGVFQTKMEFRPGPLLVTYGLGDETTTILVHGLPNRATLLTFARDGTGRQQIQQFILPLHSLWHRLPDSEPHYLQARMPLPVIRFMSTAQRLFALQSPIEGHGYEGSDEFWSDLLSGYWLDPIMGLLAGYELIRRGTAVNQLRLMRILLWNMRHYFPGFADTEIIAEMVGEPFQTPILPPLFLDGVLMLEQQELLSLPRARLEFGSMWTSWRNALERGKTAPADAKNFSFAIKPGERTRRTKYDKGHWVTYSQDGEIEREIWEEGSSISKIVIEAVKAGERIWRPDNTDHSVRNKGNRLVSGDKDFGTTVLQGSAVSPED